jgi:hypothetical protein
MEKATKTKSNESHELMNAFSFKQEEMSELSPFRQLSCDQVLKDCNSTSSLRQRVFAGTWAAQVLQVESLVCHHTRLVCTPQLTKVVSAQSLPYFREEEFPAALRARLHYQLVSGGGSLQSFVRETRAKLQHQKYLTRKAHGLQLSEPLQMGGAHLECFLY